jgi:hypothetical protein
MKNKKVTRSILALEIYGMVAGANIVFIISLTLKLITKQLGFPKIPIIICTNFYSFYEYLVRLGTTKEKRLIINIIAFR